MHHTRKDARKANSTGCGSCYGAETAQLTCCNTCEDVSGLVLRGSTMAAGGQHTARAPKRWAIIAMCQHSSHFDGASRMPVLLLHQLASYAGPKPVA